MPTFRVVAFTLLSITVLVLAATLIFVKPDDRLPLYINVVIMGGLSAVLLSRAKTKPKE